MARLVQPSNCPGLSSVILLFVTFLRWRERERQGRREEERGGERGEGGGRGREERPQTINLKAFFGLLVKQLVFMVELIVRLTESSVGKDEQPVAIL